MDLNRYTEGRSNGTGWLGIRSPLSMHVHPAADTDDGSQIVIVGSTKSARLPSMSLSVRTGEEHSFERRCYERSLPAGCRNVGFRSLLRRFSVGYHRRRCRITRDHCSGRRRRRYRRAERRVYRQRLGNRHREQNRDRVTDSHRQPFAAPTRRVRARPQVHRFAQRHMGRPQQKTRCQPLQWTERHGPRVDVRQQRRLPGVGGVTRQPERNHHRSRTA